MNNIDCAGREIQASTFLYRLKMAMQIGYGILFPSEPWQPSQWFKNVGPVTVSCSHVDGVVTFHVPVKLDHVHVNKINDVTVCLHNYVCGDHDE